MEFLIKASKEGFKYCLHSNSRWLKQGEEIAACLGGKNALLSSVLFLSAIAKVINSHSLAKVLGVLFRSLVCFDLSL